MKKQGYKKKSGPLPIIRNNMTRSRICRIYRTGDSTQADLARQFNVSVSTIHRIIKSSLGRRKKA